MWEVVNTKNVNNVGIEIVCDEMRNKQNEHLCRYLTDQQEYDRYFVKKCEKLGRVNEMKVVEKVVLKYWIGKIIRNRKIDKELKFLLKQDQRRHILMRSI